MRTEALPPTLRGEIVDRPEQVQRIWSAWDALAVHNGKPYCSPAWMMPWWNHVAPPRALLRVILVYAGQELVGVAPFFSDRGLGGVIRYRLLGAGTSSQLDILASHGFETRVGEEVARALAELQPRPDVLMFEGMPARSPWPLLLSRTWAGAGQLSVHRQFSQPAPFVELSGTTYAEWLESKSSHYRKNLRRMLRELQKHGAAVHLNAEPDDLPRAMEAFAQLHRLRWRGRGGSGVLDGRVERMLAEAGQALVPQVRFRLWSMEVGERTISSHLFVSAGGETAYWLGGFDEAWQRLQPSILTIRSALEDAFARGDSRLDLGAGGQPYKLRFSGTTEPIEWSLLVRSGVRAALARLQLARLRTRILLAHRLSPATKRVVRRALRR